MDQSSSPIQTKIQQWNRNGRLDFVAGVLSAIVSLLFLPVMGLLAIYYGYKLYNTWNRPIFALISAGGGALGFGSWLIFVVIGL